MSTCGLAIGIDFGTTKSAMAWYDPDKEQAEIIPNAEGEDTTPSLVYFGEDEVLVGNDAADELEEFENSNDPEERDEIDRRLVRSIKRNLVDPPVIRIPGRKSVRPVEVVAEILKKLKRDAEEEHFQEEVSRAVITCPAVFGVAQRRVIVDAAAMAGLEAVDLVDEAVAAAEAFVRQGRKVGRSVLVYDLGGGVLDLAMVIPQGDGGLRLAVEPDGDDRCGGDDFDRALYDYLEGVIRGKFGRPVSLTGEQDLVFLKQCRVRKENLSQGKKSKFKSLLPSRDSLQRFVHEVDRETLEGLILERIEGTVRKTARLLERAGEQGHQVDTVVLMGGSSRVPLVERRITEMLGVEPRKFAIKDYAPALGAAYYAGMDLKPPDPGPREPPAREQYRRAVESCWTDRKLSREEVEHLKALAERLGLSRGEAAEIERKAIGATVEEVLRRQLEEYRKRIDALAGEFGVSPGQSESIGLVNGPGERAVGGPEGAGSLVRPDELEGFVPARTLAGHSDAVSSVAISPDGKLLVSGSRDETITLWDLRMGEALHIILHEGWVGSVAFSPDGKVFAAGGAGGDIRLWDARTGEPLHTLAGHVSPVLSIAFGPGEVLASGGEDETVRLWNTRTGELLRAVTGHGSPVFSVAISPDGGLVCSGGKDETARLWERRTGELLHTLAGHTDWVYSVAFSPDGSLLAGGRRDREIQLWDVNLGTPLRGLTGSTVRVRSIAFSPDGKTIAGGGEDEKLRLWDVGTGKLQRTLAGHSQGVWAVAFGPGGQLVAGGSGDGMIRVWTKG